MADRPWLLSSTRILLRATRVLLSRAQDGYEYRIASPLRRLFASNRRSPAQPPKAAIVFPEDSCRRCHPDYERKPLFSTVYFSHSHPAHKKRPCAHCHEAKGAGRDEIPAMTICAQCHEEAREGSDRCEECHPPGNLFHGAQLAGSRRLGQECGVCHNEKRLRAKARSHKMPTFDPNPASCFRCHEKSFCGRCHPATHARSYRELHARDLRSRRRNQLACWSCHDARWCAAACHSNQGGR